MIQFTINTHSTKYDNNNNNNNIAGFVLQTKNNLLKDVRLLKLARQ